MKSSVKVPWVDIALTILNKNESFIWERLLSSFKEESFIRLLRSFLCHWWTWQLYFVMNFCLSQQKGVKVMWLCSEEQERWYYYRV